MRPGVPFGGFRDGSFLWGRGVIDDKFSVVTILGAVETLIAQGWRPQRRVYVALGRDEENDGLGAEAIAGLIKKQGAPGNDS